MSKLRHGAAPAPVTVREVISHWGARRRGKRIVERICQELEAAGLVAAPALDAVDVDSPITFYLTRTAAPAPSSTRPPRPVPGHYPPAVTAYRTPAGEMLMGRIESALSHASLLAVRGQVNLILTSPPFPLVRKKRYGNETGSAYLEWLRSLAPHLAELLAPDGSIVLELGNAWEEGRPVMSTLPLEALLEFKRGGRLNLCQHVICHNPARLPTPAAWVTIKRIRLKDSFTHVWWLSRSDTPKADNSRVLVPYSESMTQLIKRGTYNAGRRPSGHVISGAGFLTNHGGAIAPNVVSLDDDRLPASLVQFTGTAWDADYRAYCLRHSLEAHPARMQQGLAAMFIEMLTDPGDLVFDPFGGSNTTGALAERMGRRWLSVEANAGYVEGSRGRFDALNHTERAV